MNALARLVTGLVLCAGSMALAQQAVPPVSAPATGPAAFPWAAVVQRLASDNFADREAAQRIETLSDEIPSGASKLDGKGETSARRIAGGNEAGWRCGKGAFG